MGPARAAFVGLSLLVSLALVPLTSPVAWSADRDGDGLRDAFEADLSRTDPDDADSDGDGVVDSAEDDDGDRLSNLGEQRFGTHPRRRDSDGDGKPDGREDADGDGRPNALEQDQRPIPSSLRPTLAAASQDYAAARPDCVTGLRDAALVRCVFGDQGSDTSLVLWGDSHAVMWSPAFIRAATQERLRLTTLFKGACPSVAVVTVAQHRLDRMRSCRAWRSAALEWLRQHPPDYLVITNSNNYGLLKAGGKEILRRNAQLAGNEASRASWARFQLPPASS